ncbi:MAG: mucoidy inhibitor MuiA family protein [Beijerinckiaceae bacterium]|nr:mucoidy inhibitor MuiA family protein [Beijerinckiaceae bacterium]
MTIKTLHSGLCSAAAIAALIAGSPALAAQIEANSRISNVIVYPDSARVARVLEVELPEGATSVLLRGLPLNLDPASLRVEGEGSTPFSIGSAQTRVAPTDPKVLPESAANRLRDLKARADAIKTRIDALEGRRGMVQKFADAGPDKLGAFGGGLDIAKWTEAFEAVGRELAKVGEDIRLANVERTQVQDEIRALEASNRSPSGAQPARDVIIDLEAAAASKALITITYQVRGAYWRPAYDVKLTTDKGAKAQMELVRRALVRQRTGEDWTDAEIAVSTSRPGRGVKAPEVYTERLAFFDPQTVARDRAKDSALRETSRAQTMTAAPAPAAAPLAMRAEEREAVLEAGDFEAVFRIPGRVDLASDGSERSLRIGTRQITADLSVRAAPAFDPTAYLEASFVNTDEAPLLPGELSIQRNGVFVGRGQLEMVAPGALTRIGLGADERVKIERKPVIRKENEPTWFGQTKQEVREFRTTVQNLHPFPMKTFIVDRIPISENSAITIEQLPATTPPNDKTVEGRRGVLGWTFDIAPNETKEIKLAYRMRWPADRDVTFETLPDNGERPIPLPRPMR